MNNSRRKDLKEAMKLLNSARDYVDAAQCEEQSCFDNFPDAIQDSERGDKMQECIRQLEDAIEYIDSSIESIEEAMV